MVAEYRLNGDGKGGFQSHFKFIDVKTTSKTTYTYLIDEFTPYTCTCTYAIYRQFYAYVGVDAI